MITPEEAYDQYEKITIAARDDYLNYWLDRFKSFGHTFAKPASPHWADCAADIKGLKVMMWVSPARFRGCKLRIEFPATVGYSGAHCRDFKIVAESGLRRLMNKFKSGF